MNSVISFITSDTYALVAGAAFFAALVQSGIGLGFTPLLAPVALLLLEPKPALQTLIVLSLVSSIVFIGHAVECAKDRYFQLLCIGAICGLPLGLWLLIVLDVWTLKLGIAVLVTFAGLQALSPVSRRQVNANVVAAGTGFMSGAMTSSLGMSSAAAAWGLLLSGAAGPRIRVMVGTYLALVHIAAIAMTVGARAVYPETIPMVLALIPPTILGAMGGVWLGRRINPANLRRFVAILIIASGASLFFSLLRPLILP